MDIKILYMIEFNLLEADNRGIMISQIKHLKALRHQYEFIVHGYSSISNKHWVILFATSESELMNKIDAMPVTSFSDFDYFPLDELEIQRHLDQQSAN